MTAPLRFLLVALALIVALPSPAQAQFEGLNLSGETPKKKRVRRSRPKATTPTPTKVEETEEEESGGLGMSLDGEAPAPAATATRGGGMTFEALDVSATAEEQQRMDIASGLFKNNQYEQAAMAGQEILSDPKALALHQEARYLVAKSLYRMGLYHASLGEFSKILALGEGGKFFRSSLEWLFFISRKTKNETVILDEIARYANVEFPDKYRSEFRYLLARYHFVRGSALDDVGQKTEADNSFGEVKRLALMIPRNDPFFPRAKYLEGLAYFRDGEAVDGAGKKNQAAYRSSVEAMKEVVRLTRGRNGKPEKGLRELAFMQLARTHYGHRQNRNAMFYFDKVERGGAQWLESLFESSWASYRIGQYEQALGNLITLSSPFFRDEYFPESLILKAVIYYENCRYREAVRIVSEFERLYGPVHNELVQLTTRNLPAAEYYAVLADVQKKNKTGLQRDATEVILERILNLALTDRGLNQTNDSILELEGEMESFSNRGDTFKYSELSKRLLEDLKGQRELLVEKAGLMAKGKLERELVDLRQLLANGERIKFETTTKEKEFLEQQLAAGGTAEIVQALPLLGGGGRRPALLAVRGRVLARRAGDLPVHADQGLRGSRVRQPDPDGRRGLLTQGAARGRGRRIAVLLQTACDPCVP